MHCSAPHGNHRILEEYLVGTELLINVLRNHGVSNEFLECLQPSRASRGDPVSTHKTVTLHEFSGIKQRSSGTDLVTPLCTYPLKSPRSVEHGTVKQRRASSLGNVRLVERWRMGQQSFGPVLVTSGPVILSASTACKRSITISMLNPSPEAPASLTVTNVELTEKAYMLKCR